MEITLKFQGKKIIFGKWEEIFLGNTFSIRRSPVLPIMGTFIEWETRYSQDSIYLYRNFRGEGEASGLYSLNKIYDLVYPDILFGVFQKEQAKDHMDLFVEKYNSLKVFI